MRHSELGVAQPVRTQLFFCSTPSATTMLPRADRTAAAASQPRCPTRA
ncbi:hypothetical protein [Barrientosiimonas endolithica]|nr:hypothetical protein [Barrientosiimonas endolithica]